MVKRKKRVKKKVIKKKKKTSGEKVLLNFFKKALKDGYDPEEIRQVALKKGWPRQVIDEVLYSIIKNNKGRIKSYYSPKNIKRVKTGIKALDPLLQGGLVERSLNLISGPAGSGKTILAIKFLVEGLENGEGGIFITFEDNKEELYKSMLRFGWDLRKYELKGDFIFIYVNPDQVQGLIDGSGGEAIQELIDECDISRLVVDSMNSFSFLFQDFIERKEANLALFSLLRKLGCTCFLTVNDVFFEKNSELEFESDGIILVYHVKKKRKRVRALEVLKMRGTKIPEETFPMKITNRGISINPHKAVIF